MFRQFFQHGPELKSPREIGLMRESGKIVSEALRLCREMARPGARTIEINRGVEALYVRYGATPLFKGYKGPKVPFPAVTCISINEQVVHGIPRMREIRDGGNDYIPFSAVIDEKSLVNAMAGLLATGGSTNHTLHILPIARAARGLRARSFPGAHRARPRPTWRLRDTGGGIRSGRGNRTGA